MKEQRQEVIRMKTETYEHYVSLGKELVQNVEDRQMKICGYAIKVCTIRNGGYSAGYYTLKDYANDIGLNNKTLNQWMLIYRNVVLKLTDKQLEIMTWRQASKVNENIEHINTIENQLKGTPRKRSAPKKSVSPKEVQKLFQDHLDEKPFIGEFLSVVKQTKHTRHLLTKRDLSIIEYTHMVFLMELLDECSDIINEFLTDKRKQA